MAKTDDTQHFQPVGGLQMNHLTLAESQDRVNSDSSDAPMSPVSDINNCTAESGLEATPEGASENPVLVSRVAQVPAGLTGRAAVAAFLGTLMPKAEGGRELWLKYGPERFIKATWTDDGDFIGKFTKGKDRDRVTYGPAFGFEKLAKICRTQDGGATYIPAQPIGLPLAANVASTDDLAVEIDQGTTEEQWALYQEFSEVTDLNWSSLLTSGGKSIHGHIKAIDHLPLEQAQDLRRLLVLAMQSDPVTVRPHQPMRIPGFYRLDKESEQALLTYSLDRYSYDDLVAGLRKWFEFKNLPFPDRFTDKWWGQFHHTLKGCAKLDESKRLEKCRSLLVTGLEGFESELAQVAAGQQKRREAAAAKRDAADNGDGTPSASEQVVSASERLGDAAFDWPRHGWIGGGDKCRGDCPFHESASGTSAWIAPLSDGGGWGFHCTACTDDKPIDAFTYRWYLEHGFKAKYPSGKKYIEAVQSFLGHYGIPFEERKTQPSKKFLAEKEATLSRESVWKVPIVRDYTIGTMVWKGRGEDAYQEFEPQLDCDFHVTKELIAPDGGRLGLQVEICDGSSLTKYDILIKSVDCLKPDKFAEALMTAIGKQISCNLGNKELQGLLHDRKNSYYLTGGTPLRLAARIGRQDDGYWVFEDYQLNPDGKLCTEVQSGWVFNHELGETLKIPSPKIAPQSPDALPNLIRVLEGFYPAETFPLTLFSLGYAALTLHHAEIIKAEGGCPQMAMFGDAGGGKTLAAMAAASITGMHRTGLAAGFSTSLFYEYAKSFGGLLMLLDDAVKKGRDSDKVRDHVTNLLWAMYGALARRVQKNVQQPHTNAVATTNVALGEDNQAAESRLLKLYFPSGKFSEDSAIKAGIEEALDGASGGLGQLIGIPYDRAAIKDLKSQLLEFLPNAHNRIAGSLALITYFTQKFCDVAGYHFDAFDYCKNNLCPDANAGESGKDSLTDFIERLAILKSEGLVGEWNMTQVVKRDGSKYLAVKLDAVFPVFERKFSTNYTRQSIQHLIKGIYPDAYTNASFAASKLEWQDYERAQASFKRGDFNQTPIAPAKNNSTKCWLIPQSVIDRVWGHDAENGLDPLTNSFSAYPAPAIEPTPPSSPETAEPTFTPIEAEEIENCLTIAETAAASPESVSTAWQMLRQLTDDRVKREIWRRLSEAARRALEKARADANESDRLGIWERAA
jgi:hypothetical protein